MPVTTRLNHVHPTRDVAILEEPWTVDEVREAARRSPRPLTQKAVPGTESHQKLVKAGAVAYQQCPALQMDAAAPAAKAWVAAHAALPVESMRNLDVLELWTRWYEVVHADWSPTGAFDVIKPLFAELATQIDRDRSVICRVGDDVVAAAFVFSDDEPEEALAEALLPHHPQARTAVGSCMAHVISEANGVLRFDGHVGDPHFYPLWTTVPGVYAGTDDPLDLLEIPCGTAARR